MSRSQQQPVSVVWENQEYKILGVTSDSREVRPGWAFVAVRGAQSDGHDFLDQAIQQGASVLFGEHHEASGNPFSIPYVQVAHSRHVLAGLAAQYYGHPSRAMKLLGVTGTSGKTTTTYILESIFKAAGYSVGLIGTIQCRYGNVSLPSTHTTPGAPELQKILAEMRDAGVEVVVMEVSSHALRLQRTDFVAFDGAIFTNLSSEHLDFHPDLDDYFEAKARLFGEMASDSQSVGKKFHATIHADSPWGEKMLERVRRNPKIDVQELHMEKAVRSISTPLEGVSARFFIQDRQMDIRSTLVGRYNLENLLGATALALQMSVSQDRILAGIEALRGVPGRLERVTDGDGFAFQVFVDYAHKPDALEKVLMTLRESLCSSGKSGRLLTVFGCGGDRDRSKRSMMGAIAERESDAVWVTSDNPRTEDPLQIIQEILKGFTDQSRVHVEPDRKKAIEAAIRSAGPGDVLVIAGKGHEDYQWIGTKKIPFDDRKVAREILEKMES